MSPLTLIADVVETAVLVGVTVFLFQRADASERRSPIMFLAFANALYMVSQLYWIAHEFLTREAIYAFSAIDIASAGFYLLCGASIAMTLDSRVHLDRTVLAISTVIAFGQMVLWGMWTGAWFKDVVGGLPLWYVTYYVVLAVRDAPSFTKLESRLIAGGFIATVILQAWSFSARDSYGPRVDIVCCCLLLAIFAVLLVMLLRGWNDAGSIETTVARAFVCLLWAWGSSYLSFEPFFTVFVLLGAAMLPLISIAIVRRVEAA